MTWLEHIFFLMHRDFFLLLFSAFKVNKQTQVSRLPLCTVCQFSGRRSLFGSPPGAISARLS